MSADTPSAATVAPERHRTTRIRRETRRRMLTVVAREQLSPSMLRLAFSSPDLHDFESAAPDDHIKLFVPDGRGGEAKRDYTPRAFDPTAGTLTIDFALHDAGPATAWALAAQPGDRVEIGGPRGSAVVSDDFDWYLLIGDETALPAIARRLEELRSGVPVTVVALIDAAADELTLTERERTDLQWAHRDGDADDAACLMSRLSTISLPAGDGYVWIAAEAAVARALRAFVVEELGHPREWVKASGYWTKGASGEHETIRD